MGYYSKLIVEIETANGIFTRESDAYSNPDKTIKIDSGIITYPDSRVKTFRVCVSNDSNTWYYKDFKGTPSKTANFSYCDVSGDIVIPSPITGLGWTAISQATLNATKKLPELDPNRVLVSTPYKPRQLFGRNAHYIGNSADDEVLTFNANTRAISYGQFGQYPLYAFCRNSIWAMEVGSGDVAFKSVSPISINEGIVNKHAAVNIDAAIIYATPNGIKTIGETVELLSADIQNSDNKDDILEQLGTKTRIAFFLDKNAGRRELWVSTGSVIYAYSMILKRWFMLSGERDSFMTVNGQLVSCFFGALYREAGTGTNRIGSFTTAPIFFEDTDVMKKFRRVILRTAIDSNNQFGYKIYSTNHTDYDYTASDNAISNTVFSVDIEYEQRYEHRMRLRRTDLDLGFYDGYGGYYDESLYA